MSGDVQPRKRKDKRRKKEGTSLGLIQEPVASHKFRRSESDDLKSFDFPDQGEKIHVQNEHGIGGNICVKIIFFCLFGLLIGAVALIYLKSQGSTDVDLPTIEESRFAEYFTGWLDDSVDDHEHEAHESNVDHDDHEGHDDHEDHEDHEGHDDHDDHEDDHDEEDDHENEEELSIEQDLIYKLFGLQDDKDNKVEEENVKAEEVPVSESAISHHDADEDENEENEEDNTEEEDDEEEEEKTDENVDEDEKNKEEYTEENDKEEETEDEDSNSGVDLEERNNDDSAEDDDDDDDEDKDENEDEADLSQMDEDEEDKYISSHTEKTFKKDDEESEENGKLNKEDADDDVDDDDDDDDDDDGEEEDEKDSKGREDFKAFANNDDLGFEEIYISEEDLGAEDEFKLKDDDENNLSEEKRKKLAAAEFMKKLKAKQVESTPKEEEVEKEGGEEDLEEASGGVVVKLSVGIALIIVAHLVLVKKWKSMNNVPSDESVPTVKEIISKKQEIENLHSSVEPVISRRQTLVPENVSLNDDLEEEQIEDEEEDEEDEEEDVEDEDEEGYSEEECEAEFVKSKTDNWELFEKPTWSTQKQKNIEKEYEEPLDNEEIEDEEEYEEEIEEVEDEEDEEEEECEEDDVEDENVKQKPLPTVSDKRQEEVKETAPTPPPRTRHGRGEQDADEEDDDISYFEEINVVEESNQDGVTEGEINNNSGPEEQRTQEKKVENQDEWAFRQELNFADEQFANNPKAAVDAYDRIISNKPTMLRALVGRAKALDHWAEKEKSNAHLKKAINAYKTLLFEQGHLLDDETYVKLAERCIERMRFAGNFISSIEIHKALILKYPDTPKYRNSLAVTYLMMNKIPQARVILKETLSMWPENGFALVHYGFILKTSDNNMEEGAEKLMAGIQTREEGVIEGMFFFHLGDALNRLGREKEAMKWYELGVKEGLFLSKYQRSLYNVDRLKGQPWWTKEETTYQQFFKKLEENWREIRKEGLELLNSKGVNLFKEEAENLKDTGDWKQLDLYFRGKKQTNCNKAPITCSLVSSFKPASTCTRGQIKFSVMLPNTHVWPHCGPTNCRLRSHLGLVVPKNTFIRVAEETRSWEEGKFIIFDDSFEHEVWHNGTGLRLVLIVDVWHPELSNQERRTLSPI